MLEHTYQLLSKRKLAIPKNLNKLKSSLGRAWALDFDLQKDLTMYDDHMINYDLC